MAKPAKSQWDFGELFPVEQIARKVLSVTELTWQIRRLLEQQVGRIWVTGEITNFRAQSSGHIYFTLKDADAQLSCVLFRGELQVDSRFSRMGGKSSCKVKSRSMNRADSISCASWLLNCRVSARCRSPSRSSSRS